MYSKRDKARKIKVFITKYRTPCTHIRLQILNYIYIVIVAKCFKEQSNQQPSKTTTTVICIKSIC